MPDTNPNPAKTSQLFLLFIASLQFFAVLCLASVNDDKKLGASSLHPSFLLLLFVDLNLIKDSDSFSAQWS